MRFNFDYDGLRKFFGELAVVLVFVGAILVTGLMEGVMR